MEEFGLIFLFIATETGKGGKQVNDFTCASNSIAILLHIHIMHTFQWVLL